MHKSFLLITTFLLGAALSASAVSVSTLDKRLIRSAESFQNVVVSDTGRIPPELLNRAQGILIFRKYEVGFGLGGKGGAGVALKRNGMGGWSNPAFFKAGDGSFGFQIGAHRLDMVFLFMESGAMDRLTNGNFRIGVDAAAAAGPIGGNLEGKIGAPILVYSSTAGLYVGAKFEGGLMIPDDEANAAFYGQAVNAASIFEGTAHPVSNTAATLKDTISRYDGSAKSSGNGSEGKHRNWWEPKDKNN